MHLGRIALSLVTPEGLPTLRASQPIIKLAEINAEASSIFSAKSTVVISRKRSKVFDRLKRFDNNICDRKCFDLFWGYVASRHSHIRFW
jgi:hypothetical protein